MNSEHLFELAQLAEAAYANLWNADTAQPILVREKIKTALTAEDFSSAQADTFLDQWSVVTHQPNTESSYSSTLFKNTEYQYVLAFRGTEGVRSWDFWEADAADIVYDGLAIKQIVDLYNDWVRMNVPAGAGYPAAHLVHLAAESAAYVNATLLLGDRDPEVRAMAQEAIDALKARQDIIFDGPGLAAYSIEFVDSRALFSDERRLGTGLMDGKTLLAVTGHSLGGHLASAFTRLFPGANAQALTINGAGYPMGTTPGLGGNALGNIDNLFRLLGGRPAFDTGLTQNLYGEKGPELVTMNQSWGLVQPGSHIPVFIEAAGLGTTLGHDKGQMTDSLAVYDLLIQLDANLRAGPPQQAMATLAPILQAGANTVSFDLEGTVNAVADFFSSSRKIASGEEDERDPLYQAIGAIRSTSEYKDAAESTALVLRSLAGLSADAVVAGARTDVAYRYSLQHLSPFALTGYEALYAAHNAAGQLNRYDGATRTGSLTDAYLDDRARMLQGMLARNLANTAAVPPSVGWASGCEVYYDHASDTHLRTSAAVGPLSPPPGAALCAFGDGQPNALVGGDQDDRLYGGAGDDTLRGNAGNDYLEGGAGSDSYVCAAGGGFDTILDTDGSGRIEVDGVALTGGARVAEGIWVSADGKHSFAFDGDLQAGGPLVVDGRIRVEGFRNQDLGVVLGADAPFPPASHVLAGTAAHDSLWVGDLIVNPPAGFGEPLRADGGTGNDCIGTAAGDDSVDAGDGNDWIVAYAGDDAIQGGAGNDAIFPGAGTNRVDAGDGDDVVVSSHYRGFNTSGDVTWDEIVWQDVGWGFAVDIDPEPRLDTDGELDFVYTLLAAPAALSGASVSPELQFSYRPVAGGTGVIEYSYPGSGDSFEFTVGHERFGSVDTRPNYLSGGAGNDFLAGNAGDDVLLGGTDDDRLVGGPGTDALLGGTGHDVLLGQQGDDYIEGGGQADRAYGGSGRDEVHGGDGNDELYGDTDDAHPGDDDRLHGEAGDDRLWGNAGNDALYGGEGNDYLAGDDGTATGTQHGDDYLHGGAGQDTLVGGGGRDELIGGDGDDFLHGDDHPSQPIGAGLHGDDYLSGGQGDDNLFGGGGNDVLAGGPGQDAMEGGTGDDTYLIGPGDGPVVGGIAESIDDTAGDDTIVFTGSLSAAGMSVLRSGADLIVRYAPDDWVYVNDGFAGSIESFAFADGSRLSWTRFVGTAYGQPVTASTAEPGGMMVGGALGDVLEATGGGSTFSGGLGADTLIGAGGNNVYLYGIGDGTDRIHDTGGQLDAEGNPAPNRLRFGAGIAPEDLRLSLGSLAIRVGANPIDVIHLEGFDPGNVYGNRAIDLFEFADGRVLSYEGLVARGFDIEGTEGYDVLVGTNVDDRIAGGPGDDLLRGGDGNDVYLYGRGDGRDTLDDTAADASVDTLRLGAGILSSDVILRRSADDLLVQVRDGADEVVVRGHFAAAPIDRIELADGTAWDTTQILSRLSSELTEGPDAYFGTAGPDHVDGRGGNDVLTGGGGDDELAGGSGSDTLRGEDGDDVLAGDGEDDWLYGGAGDDVLGGGAGNDRLDGGPGSDVYLFGRGAGQDRLSQWDGDAAKVDAVQLAWDVAPSEVTVTRTGDDLVLGIGGTADTLTVAGHFWNDAGVPGYRVEEIRFADGTVWDAEWVRTAVLAGTDAAQTITGYAGADVIDAGGGADVVYGRGGDDTIGGGSGDDTLRGEEGDDVLDGGAGNDRLNGGPGNDTYRFGYGGGQDTIDEWDTAPGKIATLRLGDGVMPASVSLQRLGGSEDSLRLHLLDAGGAPIGDYVHLQGYFVSADASRRVDRIELGNGVVWDYEAVCSMLLAPTAGPDVLAAFATDDVVDGLAGNDSINGKSGNDVLLGGEGDDDLQGGLGNDRLFGGPGNDRLLGYGVWPDDAATVNSEPGDDLLHGGPGNDTLFGGQGNDVYLFERGDGSDTIGETPNTSGASTDVLRFGDGILPEDVGLYRTAAGLVFVVDGSPTQISVSNYYAAHDAQVERVELDGGKGPVWTAADIAARTDQGTPNAMTGTAADDVFLVDHEGDTIAEASGGGTDTAYASRSYVLPSNVENLTLTGPLNVNATGNALANVLRGNSGNNVLDGKDGSDSAYGGPGDDVYRNVEVVVESPGEGTDTWVNRYGGTLPANVENLYLDDGSGQHSTSAVSAIGNALDNTLVSSGLGVGGDVLDGRAGADTMIAKGWDSVVFYVDDPGDRVIASPTGQLSDEVRSYVDYTLPAHVEKLTLLGSAAIQGFGNDADNVLDGSQNAAGNVLAGGRGNDTYILGPGDLAVEQPGEGIDRIEVRSWVSTATLQGTGIEDLLIRDTAYGAGAIGNDGANTLTGNSYDNRLEGGAGDDRLLGMAGSDVLTGGLGSDQLLGGTGGDTYVLGRGDGTDTVVESYESLVSNVIRFGPGIALADLQAEPVEGALRIGYGGEGDAILLPGFDPTNPGHRAMFSQLRFADGTVVPFVQLFDRPPQLTGTLPDLSTEEDAPFEYRLPDGTFTDPEGGAVTLMATLADGSPLPAWLGFDPATATLGGTPTNGDVGVLSVRVTATDMAGLTTSGAFGLTVTNRNDAPVLALPLADQSVRATQVLSCVVPAGAFTDEDVGDRLSLGASLANGSVLPAWLAFDPASRSFTGTPGDTAIGAIDVRVTATDLEGLSAFDDFRLTVEPSGVTLVGTAANDVLTGGAGNDVLDGAAGADQMIGGAGDDTYVVDNTADKVVEKAGEGTDRVRSSVSHTLALNVEGLELMGTSAINGTGNGLDNRLTGNDAKNTLSGSTGADTLIGKAGADTLDGGTGNDVLWGGTGNDTVSGGKGNDTYGFARGDGVDSWTDYDATAGNLDLARFGEDIGYDQLWLRRSGKNLEVLVIGTTDKAVIKNWYSGSAYHVERFESGDGMALADSQVQSLVSAMAAFAPPALGQTSLPEALRDQLQPVLAAAWQPAAA